MTGKLIFCTLLLAIAMVVSCNVDDAEEFSEYDYERTLTQSQLIEQLRYPILVDEAMFCNAHCRTLIVPRPADEANWSRVSLCRIDNCHATAMCTKGVAGLRERLENCTPDYTRQTEVEPDSGETIESSAEADSIAIPAEDSVYAD
jgi:hypothetical protein